MSIVHEALCSRLIQRSDAFFPNHVIKYMKNIFIANCLVMLCKEKCK